MRGLSLLHSLLVVLALLVLVGCPEPDEASQDELNSHWSVAFDAEPVGWLLSVVGEPSGDVWAVGGEPGSAALRRFDGEDWRAVQINGEVPLVNWAHPLPSAGPDSRMVYAANGGKVLWREGGAWSLEQTPSEQDLWGIWGASADDLWAVGGRGRAEGQATILRFDGSRWRQVELPAMERPNVHAFFKVWGSGPDDVYIVGQRGAMLHWDGEALSEIPSGVGVDLIAVWGSGPDNVLAVGGRGNGVLVHYDGEGWTSVDGNVWQEAGLFPLSGLNGVWLDSAEEAWVVGIRGTVARIDLSTYAYTLEPTGTGLDLHAVWGDRERGLFTVGGNFTEAQGPYRGVALRREFPAEVQTP